MYIQSGGKNIHIFKDSSSQRDCLVVIKVEVLVSKFALE